MTSKCFAAVALVLSLLPLSPAFAAEGVLVVSRITTASGTTTTQVQIEKTRMRAEITGSTEAQVVVFDGAKQVMWVITPARKSYLEITKAELEQLSAQMQGMMAMMQAQMANLPPAQRAQMEGMMRGRGMSAAPAERTTYKRAGSDRVGKWACDKYEGYRGADKVSDLCTVAPAALGFTAADFAITQQLTEFIKTALPQAGDQVAALGRAEVDGFSGFPVRSVTTAMGRTTTSELTEASRQTFADSLFAVPTGFQKQTLPSMGSGGMGMGR